MRYRHKTTGRICELVRRINGNLLCVDCENRNHYLCYPVEEWEAA